ncbi:MAG: hypothetical protein IJB64_00145 [Akkermansia sp.]|nr:hypothetical protein [Akkermansia sp.]
MKKLIIVGLSKTAMHAYEFVKFYGLYDVIGFAVSAEYRNGVFFNGLPVYALETLADECKEKEYELFVAVLWNHLNRDRKNLYEFCKKRGFKLANLISPTAIVRSELKGDNCWIHDYVVVQNNANLGSDIMIMAYTLIGANTKVDSHCFFGARSLLGGGSIVGEQCFIGMSATIFDDTHIGNKCIVGACTAVKRNVPDYSRYVTNSDDIVIKTYGAETIENKLIFSKNKR